MSDEGERAASRRAARYAARWRMRRLTKLPRLAGCGRWLNGSAEGVVVVKMADGVAHYSGLQSCGSVWSCPRCSAKIRNERTVEVEEGVANWLRAGRGVEMVTLTVPHGMSDALEATFGLVAAGWRQGVLGGRRFGEDRLRFGIAGYVRTIEVTYGAHGWHPHVHALLFTRRPLSGRSRALLSERLFERWSAFVAANGGGVCSRDAFRIVPGGRGAGAYITKLQGGPDGGRSLALEFTRQDLKVGRGGSVTPFELLAPASAGDDQAASLWSEWEAVTRGRRCQTWSRGCRRLLGLDAVEASDQALADADAGGQYMLEIDGHETWPRIAAVAGLDARILHACEAGGFSAVVSVVREALALARDP